MIYHWKDFELEITDFDYQHDRTPLAETRPSQIPELQTCRGYKNSNNYYIWYIIGKVLTWRSQILNITLIRRPQLKLYHLKPQTLEHVEIIKVSDKPTHDTSLERS